jgi:hypothetical protein
LQFLGTPGAISELCCSDFSRNSLRRLTGKLF